MFYLRNVGCVFLFHDAELSLEDILNDTVEGIDQPKMVKLEEEEDNILENGKG